MKFQEIGSFFRSLEQSFPSLALILAPQDFEREKIFTSIFTMVQEKGRYQMAKFSCLEMAAALEALSSSSLFALDPFVIVDGVEALGKKEESLLSYYLNHPSRGAFLLLGAREKKGIPFYAEVEKKGVVLDLSYEKAKDREKRLAESLMAKCSHAQKTIDKEAIASFFAKTGLDLATVESEAEKLLTFVGEKKQIQKEDVALICSSSDMRNLWQMAEDFVWHQKHLIGIDNSLFHALVSAIRYQLEQGIRFSSSDEKREEPSYFYKKEEEKRKIALEKGPLFFKKLLRLLFEIDLLSKNQVTSYDSLLAYFQAKMSLEAR